MWTRVFDDEVARLSAPQDLQVEQRNQSAWFIASMGEHNANVLPLVFVALRSCTVSFKGVSGVRHSVDVTAETLYEAAAMGLAALRKGDWSDVFGPGTQLEVRVREPATTHTLTVQQIRRWCDGVAVSPDEVLRRKKVKALLA